MINAASELERWAPGIAHEDAVRPCVRPLFEGMLSPGRDGAGGRDGLDGQGA